MLGSAIIVLRETLEAALVLGIVAAATRSIAGRGRWIFAGVALGVAGSLLVAVFTRQISAWADGVGQEIFNAAVLGIAVAMLAWHNIWMGAHAKELVADARGIATQVRDGQRALGAIAIVIALAVLREGSETVLFLFGTLAGGDSAGRVIVGGLGGLATGIVAGIALYAGLITIPLGWFFGVTSTLIAFVAAGMAGQAARFLVQADVLPPLVTPLWDTSQYVGNESGLGSVLHALVGYEARPAATQILFSVATLAVIALGMRAASGQPRKVSQ